MEDDQLNEPIPPKEERQINESNHINEEIPNQFDKVNVALQEINVPKVQLN